MAACTVKNKKIPTSSSVNPHHENTYCRAKDIRINKIGVEFKRRADKSFKDEMKATVGDCQALGQKPITFIRQVLALLSYPELLQNPQLPEDAKLRAREILEDCGGNSIGAYPDCPGIEIIRKHCADFIERRDGHPCDWQDIVLGCGATDCITGILELFKCEVEDKKPGIMVPIPEYPLYSSTLDEFKMHKIGYHLDEANSWSFKISELQNSIEKAKQFSHPRAIVVINPGNPTGQVFNKKDIQDIIEFAYQENLVILADEVNQFNIYDEGTKFHSLKKVAIEMGSPYSKMELFSFMSCSKGYMGECGIRGGYVEIFNMNPSVREMYMKILGIIKCPNVLGQAVMDVLCNPPRPIETSYEIYQREQSAILQALKAKAKLVKSTFSALEGFSCNPLQGGMYAFPQIKLPTKAIKAAENESVSPDYFYALCLLKETGILMVPGSTFGQISGTYHLRATIVPQIETLNDMLTLLGKFNGEFMAAYS